MVKDKSFLYPESVAAKRPNCKAQGCLSPKGENRPGYHGPIPSHLAPTGRYLRSSRCHPVGVLPHILTYPGQPSFALRASEGDPYSKSKFIMGNCRSGADKARRGSSESIVMENFCLLATAMKKCRHGLRTSTQDLSKSEPSSSRPWQRSSPNESLKMKPHQLLAIRSSRG